MAINTKIKFSKVALTATGVVIVGTAGSTISVLGYTIVANAPVAVKFQSDGTDLTGPMALAANGGIASAIATYQTPLLRTYVGQSLKLDLDANVGVNGHITYFLEN